MVVRRWQTLTFVLQYISVVTHCKSKIFLFSMKHKMYAQVTDSTIEPLFFLILFSLALWDGRSFKILIQLGNWGFRWCLVATHIEKVTHILSALNYEQSQRIFKKELKCVGTLTFFIIETFYALWTKYVYGHKFLHLIFNYLQCDDLWTLIVNIIYRLWERRGENLLFNFQFKLSKRRFPTPQLSSLIYDI